MWGGVGLVLAVSDTAAAAEFDCASGTVPAPLRLDATGRFNVRGSVTLGHGGPEREGEEPDVRGATYRGWLDDDVLTMTVQIDDVATTGQPFVLRFGDPGSLRRCL